MPKHRTHISIEFFRRQLAQVDALPQLVLIAVAVGLITGAVIVGFRLVIDYGLPSLFGRHGENFEGLAPLQRLGLLLGGGILLAAGFQALSASERRVGVVHVMERLSRHQGYLPLKGALVQLLGGAVALITGQSGGREGPAIHLGAATSSWFGQVFKLPNNSMRTLVACGTAAGIASSFNTPIAGVIFAMEVVMMEYSIASFLPVIVASVTATFVGQVAFGDKPLFTIAPADLRSFAEIPYIIFAGAVVGTVAALYIQLVQYFARFNHRPAWIRILAATLLTGMCALVVPQVMGVGYDTVDQAMLGQLGLFLLAAIVVLKALTSAATVGLGLPVGIIGPSLVIGAALGAIFAQLAQGLDADVTLNTGLYVMLGMAAMMAAVLQAPLAALLAVLELTANPNIILPAMLVIVVATLITNQLFRQRSVFISTLDTLGLQYPPSPVALHLQRAGVAAIMNRQFVRLSHETDSREVREALQHNPQWVVVEADDHTARAVLNAADLLAYLQENPDTGNPGEKIALMKIPAQRYDLAEVDSRATVHEAQQLMRQHSSEACIVRRFAAPMIRPIIGIITQADIDNYRKVIE